MTALTAGALVVGSTLAGAAVGPRSVAAADRVTVVASFYPLAEATRVVGGTAVRVTDLTPAGAEPHDLELTTDDRDAIEDADLVVDMGDDFQPAVERAADDRDGTTLEILPSIGVDREQALHDPHVWLDPVLMGRIVVAIERALVRVDRHDRVTFARHAAAYRARLAALNGDYRTGLAQCDRRLVVTGHEAFGWLAQRYGLRQEGVAGIDPEAEPDPRRLAELADLVRREGVTTIFTEELVSPKVARTLAREAGGLKTVVLNPLESLSDAERARGADYLSVMRASLAKIRRALGCS